MEAHLINIYRPLPSGFHIDMLKQNSEHEYCAARAGSQRASRD
jgi:hypothetical protein